MDILNESLQVLWQKQKHFENLQLHRLSYRWEKLMDPMMNENTFVKEIQAPFVVIYVSHPMWKQHLLMQKSKLIAAMNEELGKNVIQDFKLELISYDKIKQLKEKRIEIKKEIEDSLPKDEIIPFEQIHLSEEAEKKIDQKLERIKNISLKNVLRKICEQQQKKEKYLLENGYHRCPVCQHMIEGTYCFFCEEQKEKQLRIKIKEAIENKPWLTYQEFFHIQPCRFELFRSVKKQIVATYSDMIYKGSTDWYVLCMYTMLVTGRSNEEIDRELVLKRTEKLRTSYEQFVQKYKTASK